MIHCQTYFMVHTKIKRVRILWKFLEDDLMKLDRTLLKPYEALRKHLELRESSGSHTENPRDLPVQNKNEQTNHSNRHWTDMMADSSDLPVQRVYSFFFFEPAYHGIRWRFLVFVDRNPLEVSGWFSQGILNDSWVLSVP